MSEPSLEALADFWSTYIGNRTEISSDAITQVFCRGPMAGLSIREAMVIAAGRLGRTPPRIVVEHHFTNVEETEA